MEQAIQRLGTDRPASTKSSEKEAINGLLLREFLLTGSLVNWLRRESLACNTTRDTRLLEGQSKLPNLQCYWVYITPFKIVFTLMARWTSFVSVSMIGARVALLRCEHARPAAFTI